MDEKHLIYAFIDDDNNYFNIGRNKNLKNRIRHHVYRMKTKVNYPKYSKFNKILRENNLEINRENVTKYVVVIEENIPWVDVNDREIHYIKEYNKQFDLKNLTEGGEGGVFTEEVRKRLSKNRMGSKHSEESKKKMSESHKGIPKSEEHKQALKEAWKTRPAHTDETRRKMSKTSTGKINIKTYKCVDPDGKEYITTKGLTQFCKEHNLQQSLMSSVSVGKRKHHKGWLCELIISSH